MSCRTSLLLPFIYDQGRSTNILQIPPQSELKAMLRHTPFKFFGVALA